jgi:hypothetical protein
MTVNCDVGASSMSISISAEPLLPPLSVLFLPPLSSVPLFLSPLSTLFSLTAESSQTSSSLTVASSNGRGACVVVRASSSCW